MLVGVISDTHGSLPPGLEEAFAGVERIIHAGDVGNPRVLLSLEAIAPVVAVRGNMDTGELEWRLPDTAVVRLGERRVFVTHKPSDVGELVEGTDVVVVGHTHSASVQQRGPVLLVNPGAAGNAGRDGRGPTVALLDLTADPPSARIVEL
jgi:putative phosphoesterase